MSSRRDRSLSIPGSLRLVAAVILASSAPAAAQGIRISGPMAAGPGQAGDVRAFALAPDGSRAVYLADQVAADVVELFSVPLDGSAGPVLLSGTLVAGGDCLNGGQADLAVAPAGNRVVYVADAEEDEVFELFSAPLDGSAAPVKLDGTLVPGGDVRSFRVRADGAQVVFLADASTDEVFDLLAAPLDGSASPITLAAGVSTDGSLVYELGPLGDRAVYVSAERIWSVPLDGSASPLELTGALITDGAVVEDPPLRIDATGARAVFMADKDTDEVFEVYSVPLDGSALPVKLNGPLAAGVDVTKFDVTPDGARVVFFAKALYSVPTAGGAPSAISLASEFAISPDSSRVVYAQHLGGGVHGLFSRAADASGSAVQLNPGGDVELCAGGVTFAISPDSTRVAFLESVGGPELYGVPIDGSAAPVQLSAGAVQTCAAGAAFPFALPISPLGRVLYFADPDVDDVFELFSVPIDGSAAPVALDDLPACGGDVTDEPGLLPRLVPLDERVVYAADQDTDEVRELFAVAADKSSGPVKLNAPLVPDVEAGDVVAFEIGADGAFAAYLADPDEDERLELFAVALGVGPAAPVRISGTLAPCGDVALFRLAPDGARAVFVADQDTDGVAELYAVPLDGSASPLRLNDPFGPGGGMGSSPLASFPSLEIAPDSSRVLFYARTSGVDPLVLHSAPLDGSTSPVPLAEATAFRLAPDGARVAYLSPLGELLSVPIDGSAAPVNLTGTLAPFASLRNVWLVPEFEVSADGARAVFVGDLATDEVVELYSVPLDGSAAPVKLNGNLAGGGDVRGVTAAIPSFRLTPDGQQVVCSADTFFDEQLELLGVPIDGSAAWTQLSGAMVAGGDLLDYAIAPDGGRVLYLADQQVNGTNELYSRRLDGIGFWMKLNDALAFNRDVLGFRISPDSSRAVFQADVRANDVFELFSVPVDDSAPPVLVSRELVAGGSIASYQAGADGRVVVYLADRIVDEHFELFRAPMRGGPSERVSGELVAGGDVTAFALGRAGRVLYLADQETDGVVELHASLPRTRIGDDPTGTVMR